MISPQTKQRILDAADLVTVIQEAITLKKSGASYHGCCPFHNEDTPSFIVTPSKGIFKCFGCGEKGNVIDFVMKNEAISYPEAAHLLGKQFNIEVENEELTPEQKKYHDKRESLRAANEWAAIHYAADLSRAEAAAYITERGTTPEIVEKFRLGFAVDGWHNLASSSKLKGFNKEILVEAGLLGQKENKVFDLFRNRIMFPFFDLTGNVIGFTGRLLVKSEKEPKYSNTSETPLFTKGKVLFGLFQAKKEIQKQDKCYLVEGNFDVTTFHQYGIGNTVCGSGTALTVDQIRLIKRFTPNITLVYDGDKAGIKASFKNIDLLLEEGVNVRAIALPAGEDPDSFARKGTTEELAKYLEDNEKDFISFKYEFVADEIERDPIRESKLLNEFLTSISLIPDKVSQDVYIRRCINIFGIKQDVIDDVLSAKPTEVKEPERAGWIGIDNVIDAIKEKGCVYVTADIDEMFSEWRSGKDKVINCISYKGVLQFSHLQELKAITSNVIIIDPIDRIYTAEKQNSPNILFAKNLFAFGFNVQIGECASNGELSYDTFSFIDKYFDWASDELSKFSQDNSFRNIVIEQAAELLSHADNTTIISNSKVFARRLGLNDADFKKILKPFQEKKKSKSAAQLETIDEGENMHLDPDRLPEYVDRNFFAKWGYFPYQNPKGQKVRYVFRTQEGGLQVVGNFYIEPLFHVYNKERAVNKRIIRVNNAEQNRSFFLEMKSDEMADFASFKKVLFNEGGNWFTKGKSNHYDSIMASISCRFDLCYELDVFGQQTEGFWAFPNAIFADGHITYMDEMGLVQYKDTKYFSPAVSKINAGQRGDNDKYENDKHFIYQDTNHTTFAQWASLMDDVYAGQDNGKWAILFAIMSGYRSIIYPIDRLFTSLFIIGPTESGKSQIAISIRSLYMKYEAPLFNLNSGTDAAFFTTLERFCDVPVVYEEYNDMQISPIKFQGLKAAVYDGEGKTKKKDATSKDLDISKVRAAPIILGQEAPEQDDGSLGNRCVLLNVPKKDDWTEAQTNRFQLLKEWEKKGLSNVLIEILKQRGIVKENFQRIQRAEFKRMKDDLSKAGASYQTRILNTVSLFCALCRLWEEHIPAHKLPFTYAEFYEIAKAKIISQSEAITSSNRVSVFFDTLELLLNRPHGGLTPGKEYKIEIHNRIVVQRNRNESEEKILEGNEKVIFLRLNILHPMYQDVRKGEALKLNNLMNYLKDHPGYIGPVSSTRFKWTEISKIADVDGKVKEVGREASTNTSAIAFRYKTLGIDLDKYTEAIAVNFDKPTDTQLQMGLPDGVPDDLPF